MWKNAAPEKKYEWNHITLKKNTLNLDWVLKKRELAPNSARLLVFTIFFSILFIFFFKSFFLVLFLLLSFFFVVSLFRIYGLLVYSSSLYRSCALFSSHRFGDRLCCRSNCDGSIGQRDFRQWYCNIHGVSVFISKYRGFVMHITYLWPNAVLVSVRFVHIVVCVWNWAFFFKCPYQIACCCIVCIELHWEWC